MKKFNINLNLTKLLIAVLLLSFLVGGIAGGVAGFLVSSAAQERLAGWLPSFLGTRKEKDAGEPSAQTEPLAINADDATTAVVNKVLPSVVSIVVTKELAQVYNMTGPDFSPFDDFFGDLPFEFKIVPPQNQERKTEKREVGGGTGFVVSEDGLILTNKHVVFDADAEYSVVAADGKRYNAEVLARDPFVDIAILKIKGDGLTPVELGDSDKLKVGQTVIAIGNSLSEYQNTVTKGVISGIGRRVEAGGAFGSEVIEGAIQTDAAINPGNSGGPLVNLRGEVIGVNTAISQQGQLIGFAIPINEAKKTIESIKKYGRIVRPWLGVRYLPLNKEIAEKNDLPIDYGALLVRGSQAGELAVVPSSPADKAGLEENDIILEINNVKIDQDRSLAKEIAKYNPGDEVSLKVLHKGEEKVMKVKLEEYRNK